MEKDGEKETKDQNSRRESEPRLPVERLVLRKSGGVVPKRFHGSYGHWPFLGPGASPFLSVIQIPKGGSYTMHVYPVQQGREIMILHELIRPQGLAWPGYSRVVKIRIARLSATGLVHCILYTWHEDYEALPAPF